MASLSRPSAGVSSVTELTVVDGATFDTTTLVVDDNNNRVGINTATPTAALDIDGDVQLTPTAISTAHVKTTGSLDVRCTANLKLGTEGADSIRLGRTNSTGAKIHLRSGADTDLVVTNSKVGIGTETPKTDLTVEGTITLKEQAAADGDTAAYGQMWVKTATPNQLYFTTDAGDDIQITSGTSLAATGDITEVTAGTGISGGGTSGGVTLNLDTHSLTEAAIADGDFIVFNDTSDSNAPKREALADVATLFAGTGLTASSSVMNVDASQTQITAVGTIATGTWQGTAIASAYLDADTAHLSGTQTFSGAKTFSAAAQFSNTVTVGADDQGYDVILYGDTASANVTWDTSEDDLILNGAARIVVPDGQLVLGSTALGSTAAELNLLDGSAKSTSSITVADTDALIVIDGTTTKQIPASDIKTYVGGASVLDDLSDVAFSSGDLTITALDTLTTSASAHNAAGTAVKVQAGTTTAGTTNNIAGGALTLAGGQGKGSGAGGDIIFQVANAGGSGSSLNSLATALTISDDLSSTFAGAVEVTGNTTVANNLFCGKFISHTSDIDTRIVFFDAGDIMALEAGGVEFARLSEGSQDEFVINDLSGDVDFRVESDDETHMFFVDSNNNRISIGDSVDAPAATLEVTNHASAGATGAPLLQLNSNDVDQIAVDINAANTTANVVDINADALTSGQALSIVSESTDDTNRALLVVVNEDPGATGAICFAVRNDAPMASNRPTVQIQDTGANTEPILSLKNANVAIDKPPILEFERTNNTAEANGMDLGKIQFRGVDSGNNRTIYGSILCEADPVTGGQEGGRITIAVAEHDGTVTDGLILEGGNADGEVDVIIAAGATSVTTISGTLELGERNITNVGDISLDSISSDASLVTINAPLEIAQGASGGAACLVLDNDDTNQIALNIEAANIDADVIQITADALTTSHVIDVTADALTSGSVLNLVSNAGNTTARNLVSIHNDHASATAAMPLSILNDAGGDMMMAEGKSGASMALRIKELSITINTGSAQTSSSGFFPAGSIGIALAIRVTTQIDTNKHITKIGTGTSDPQDTLIYGSPSALGDGVLDEANDTQIFGLNWGDQLVNLAAAQDLVITCDGTPGAGVVKAVLYYWALTAPTG